jgi:hypothetical protein
METPALDSQKGDEMKRALIALAVTALTALSVAGPASAASSETAQVTHISFSGNFASAYWVTSSADRSISTYIDVSQSTQGYQLYAIQNTDYFDANGNYTGETSTSVLGATSGFSFAFAPSLMSASLNASAFPATIYTFDASRNETVTSATTIDMNVSWTGQGPITRSVFNQHVTAGGFTETTHTNGAKRDATATATIAGFTPSAASLQFASLENDKEGSVTVIIGSRS